MKLKANGLRIEFEDTACIDGEMDAKAAKRPVVLLIMGLGMQLVAWPPQMVQELTMRSKRAGIGNIQAVVADLTPTFPKWPAA